LKETGNNNKSTRSEKKLTGRSDVIGEKVSTELPLHQRLSFPSDHVEIFSRNLHASTGWAAGVRMDIATQEEIDLTSNDGSTLSGGILQRSRTALATGLVANGAARLVESGRAALTEHPGMETGDALLHGNGASVLHVEGQADQPDPVTCRKENKRRSSLIWRQ
jgi:hypothetical protein